MSFKLTLIAELPGHEDRAWHVAWNPVKPLLATCSADKSVRIYSYSNDNFKHLTTIATEHKKTVRAIAWSPSGSTLATASFDSYVSIWEQEVDDDGQPTPMDWECVGTLEGHENECKSVGFSCSGDFLASCSRDKSVWLWAVLPDDDDYSCEAVLMEHSQDVKCVAWHPAEEILASASYDDTVKIYLDDPTDDWYCSTTLTGHTSTVWSLAWSPDGKYIASASDDRTIRVWQKTAQTQWPCVLVIQGHDRSIYSISWGVGKGQDNLGWLASAGGDGVIRVFELSETSSKEPSGPMSLTSQMIASLHNSHSVHDANAVAWCPRPGFTDLLASVGDDGIAKVWRLAPA